MATTGGALDEWTAMAARNSGPKRTHHPSDSPLENSSDHDSDTENARATEPSTGPLTDARDVIPNRNFGYSTGPKGIIKDARDARAARASSPRKGGAARPQRNDAVNPYVDNLQDGRPSRNRRGSGNDEDDDDALFAELEAEAPADAARYEQSRRAELQRSLRLQDVSGPAFETMVAAAGPETVVVGFVYDDHPDIWQRLEFCIRDVARRYDIAACKIHYAEVRFERSSAPAILAYRGAEEVAHVLNVYEEISVGDVSVDVVEALFSRYHIV